MRYGEWLLKAGLMCAITLLSAASEARTEKQDVNSSAAQNGQSAQPASSSAFVAVVDELGQRHALKYGCQPLVRQNDDGERGEKIVWAYQTAAWHRGEAGAGLLDCFLF